MAVKVSSSVLNRINNISDLQKGLGEKIHGPVTKFLEILLGGAVTLNVSDIHFEPQKKLFEIRVRIDGMLQRIIEFDSKLYPPILSRIKLISGAKLNVTDRPQPGRFTILTEKNPIEARTSTLPTPYREAVVLRILNPQNLIGVKQLGLRSDLTALLETELKRPNGMIIVTGPTGVGKTTTLYAFLKKIQKPEIKIITIEDPIEYHLKGIAQTQVAPKKGYDFASGLKAIMRQDPDVILVGEIRDSETSKMAIQAALTGHLVLSTLHANDAAGTIARLVTLQTEPANIGPALNLIIAQRLLRKVCPKCSQLKKVSVSELEKLKKNLDNVSLKDLNLPSINQNLKIPVAKGCQNCNMTGYQGRTGIFEILKISREIEKFILANPSIAALREKAIKEGMTTIYQDGLVKVIEGRTTLKELARITGK